MRVPTELGTLDLVPCDTDQAYYFRTHVTALLSFGGMRLFFAMGAVVVYPLGCQITPPHSQSRYSG